MVESELKTQRREQEDNDKHKARKKYLLSWKIRKVQCWKGMVSTQNLWGIQKNRIYNWQSALKGTYSGNVPMMHLHLSRSETYWKYGEFRLLIKGKWQWLKVSSFVFCLDKWIFVSRYHLYSIHSKYTHSVIDCNVNKLTKSTISTFPAESTMMLQCDLEQ